MTALRCPYKQTTVSLVFGAHRHVVTLRAPVVFTYRPWQCILFPPITLFPTLRGLFVTLVELRQPVEGSNKVLRDA